MPENKPIWFLVLSFIIFTTPAFSEVVINEIMWDELQYIELYNNSNQTVNIDGWSLFNENGFITTFYNKTILPDSYFLIEEDEEATFIAADWITLLNLKVSGDTLTLKNNFNQIMNTANQIGSGWFAGADTVSGISMELLNPSLSGTLAANWATSIGNLGGRYGTPGAGNSVYYIINQPRFIINKINFKNSPDWVEIRCLDDAQQGNGLNLNGYYLTDMGEPDKVISNSIIKTGETLRITYNSSALDETSTDSGNQNGILELYTTTNDLVSTDEQAVFKDTAGKILDAAVWSDGDLSREEAEEVAEISQLGQWQAACIDSKLVTAGYLIERVNEQDSNTAADWRIAAYNAGSSPSSQLEEDTSSKIENLKIIPNPLWLDHTEAEKRKTVISFYLKEDAEVTAIIYDSMGRLIRKLQPAKTMKEGENQLSWRGENESNNSVPVGIYVLYLKIISLKNAEQKIKTIVVGRKH